MRAVGIVEGSQGQWLDLIPAGEPIEPWLEEALVKPFRFSSVCGTMDLIVGVPKHCEHWRMPHKTQEQKDRAAKLWAEISAGTLLETLRS